MEDQKILDVKKKAAEIQEMYRNDSTQDSFNVLLTGETAQR
jgi:hypothetical protein